MAEQVSCGTEWPRQTFTHNYTCIYCGQVAPAPRHGLPDYGYLIGPTRGRQEKWTGWLCGLGCVANWAAHQAAVIERAVT